MYTVKPSTQFKVDLKLAEKRHRDMGLLKDVVKVLASGGILAEKHRDHPLKGGKYKGKRDCHISPDWILIYEIQEKENVLYLARTGTHSDLF